MSHVQQISILALCFLRLLVVCSVAPAEQTPLRVAIVDTSDKQTLPPGLVDLLTVELSKGVDIELLERHEIGRILREQARDLAFPAGESRTAVIEAGRLLGANALVLVSAGPQDGQKFQPIEASIVETSRGVRFGKSTIAWSKDEKSISRQLESATAQLISRLRRIRSAQDQLTVISLAGFRTDELSQDAHRVRFNFESWLRVWLADQPGIAVAERTKMLPLIDERKLSEDVPATLGEADVTIDGTFRLDFSGQQPQVELSLRVLRKDRSVAERTLRGNLASFAKLRKKVGATILELMAIDPSSTAFDTDAEVELLTEEAKRLLSLHRKYEALDRLIAAYAFDPESLDIQAKLLQAGRGIGVGLDFSGSEFAGSFFPTALLLSDVARQVLDQIEQGQMPEDKTASYNSEVLLGHIIEHCKLMSQVQFLFRGREPSERELVQQEWLRKSTDELFKRYFSLAKARGGPVLQYAVYCGLQAGIYWAKSPEAAFEQRIELFEQAAKLTNQTSFGLWTITGDHRFRLTSNKSWADRDDLGSVYENYFSKLETSEYAEVRAVGQREAANYSLWILKDRTRAMRHYRLFIDIIIEEIIPNHPRLADASHGLWLHLNEKRGYLELTSEEAGKYWSSVILARWTAKRLPPRNSQNWEHLIKGTLLHLEKAEEAQHANYLLQTCIESLEKAPVGLNQNKIPTQWQETLSRLQQLQQGLKERHPELGGGKSNSQPTLAVDCKSCLTIEQAVSKLPNDARVSKRHWFFSGLAPTSEGYVVSYVIKQGSARTSGATRFASQEWAAIAKLDKTGKLQSTTFFPEPFTYDYRRSRLTGVVGQILRPLVATDAGVFLSVPANGIVWFRLDKPPIHFSSKHLETPTSTRRPVPFEEALELTSMNGKLYFKSGPNPLRPQIYEFDYNQGRSTLLLDAQTLNEQSTVFGKIGFSFTPNPPGHLYLWTWADGVPREGDHDHEPSGGDLFLLDLKDKSIQQVKLPRHLSHPWVRNDEQFHLGLKTSRGSIAIFNSKTLSLEWLLKDKSEDLPTLGQASLRTHQFAHNSSYLLTSAKRPGAISERERRFHIRGGGKVAKGKAASDWLLYKKSSAEFQRLEADQMPAPDKVRRFLFISERQILMLTSKTIFLITLPTK